MSSAQERAAQRRALWTGGVARSFAEAEVADLEFWLAATPQERIRGVTDLVSEMGESGETGEPTLRLQRAIGGTRPRKG